MHTTAVMSDDTDEKPTATASVDKGVQYRAVETSSPHYHPTSTSENKWYEMLATTGLPSTFCAIVLEITAAPQPRGYPMTRATTRVALLAKKKNM